MNYEDAKAKIIESEKSLASWGKTLTDPNKCYPVVKAEWNRAFDRREEALKAAVHTNPQQFMRDFPSSAWLACYFGLI